MAVAMGASIVLGADRRKLRRDLAKAKRDWRTYSRQVGDSLKQMGRNAALVAGGIAVAFAAATRAALKTADSIAKAARNANLSIVDYQKLQHAFDLAGVAQSSEKALLQLARSITDLGRGLSTQVDIFKDIGLTFEDLEGLKIDDALYRVLDAMRETTNETTRMAAAQVILGRSGKTLGTLLDQTNDQLRAQGDRLEALGGTITAFGKDAELINDEMEVLSKVSLASFINGLDDAFGGGFGTEGQRSQIIKDVGEAIREVSTSLANGLRWIWLNRDALAALVKVWVIYRVVLAGVFVVQTAVAAAMTVGAFVTGLATTIKLMGGLVVATKAATLWMGRLFAAMLRFAVVPAILVGVVTGAYQAGKAFRSSWDSIKDAGSKLGTFIGSVFDVVYQSILLTIDKGSVAMKKGFKSVINTTITALNWVKDQSKSLVNRFIDGINSLAKLKDPNAELMGHLGPAEEIGPFTGLDDAISIGDETVADTERKLAQVAAAARTNLQSFLDADSKALNDFTSAWVAGMQGAVDSVKDAFTAVFESLKGIIDEHAPFLWDLLDFKKIITDIGSIEFEIPESPKRDTDTETDTETSGDYKNVATNIVTNTVRAMGDALRDGDWKSLGKTFLSVVQNALIESLVQKATGALLKGLGLGATESHEGSVVPGGPGTEHLRLLEGGQLVLRADQAKALGMIVRSRIPTREGGMMGRGGDINIEVNELGAGFTQNTKRILVNSVEDFRYADSQYLLARGNFNG